MAVKEENDFRVRPGRIRAREPSPYRPFVARALEAAERAAAASVPPVPEPPEAA